MPAQKNRPFEGVDTVQETCGLGFNQGMGALKAGGTVVPNEWNAPPAPIIKTFSNVFAGKRSLGVRQCLCKWDDRQFQPGWLAHDEAHVFIGTNSSSLVHCLCSANHYKTVNMKNNIKPKLLRQMNERTIFELLQMRGPSSRAELSRISKISAPTVSKTVETLIKASLLEELDDKTKSGVEGGRPATLVRLAEKSAMVIGVVLDVTHCQLAMTGLDGTINKDNYIIFPTPKTYTNIIDTIITNIKLLMSLAEGKVVGICLSTPGFSDRHTGTIIYSSNLPALNGHKPHHDLEKRLKQKVTMMPERDALCLSENMFGKEKGSDDIASSISAMVAAWEWYATANL